MNSDAKNSTTTSAPSANRVRKALVMPNDVIQTSCAMEFSANDHFMTQNLKLLLNVNA
jgi:hypothetical protein